ncbi:MAG TPA: hypothetical protein VL463_06525 [Kofleriaceae bacterium]|jgi:hypothetical protein|nr:hypothetical protein [Kofleriaceae bacterium]
MNKRSKKLTLSRQLVRALTERQLQTAAGGEISYGFICHPYPSQDACSLYPCSPSGDKCY